MKKRFFNIICLIIILLLIYYIKYKYIPYFNTSKQQLFNANRFYISSFIVYQLIIYTILGIVIGKIVRDFLKIKGNNYFIFTLGIIFLVLFIINSFYFINNYNMFIFYSNYITPFFIIDGLLIGISHEKNHKFSI